MNCLPQARLPMLQVNLQQLRDLQRRNSNPSIGRTKLLLRPWAQRWPLWKQLEDSVDEKQKTINQLEERIEKLNLKQQDLQTKAKTEKTNLENDIQQMRLKSFGQIQVTLKSPRHGTFISITKEGATGIAASDGREALILIRHPDGTFSFHNNGHPIAYLSNSNKCDFGSNHTCGITERFRLHYADDGKTHIESVHFPGSFLSPLTREANKLVWCNYKSVHSAFCMTLT
ncbi:hypothetical protein BDZ91DRAFT_48200 [Kalaharituber pfeilii]|nr:hypothetical protein BDZ91DRAFT_48200 [Kalaharituber pfeilii]